MADVTINAAAVHWQGHTPRRQVVTDASTVYLFLMSRIAGANGLRWIKSVDSGETYSAPVSFSTATDIRVLDVYHARWTSSGAANVTYIAWGEFSTGIISFAKFNHDTDTFSIAETVVQDLTGTIPETLSIVYARNGDLFLTARTRAGSAQAITLRSQNDGTSWSAVAALTETAADQIVLWPDFSSADTADILGIFLDHSASQVSVKQLDVSLNSVTETVIASSIDSWGDGQTNPINWSMTLNASGVLYLALANEWTAPAGGVTIATYTVNGATVTATTDVITSTAYVSAPYLSRDTLGIVYCFYGIDPEGLSRESQVYAYKSSADNMATWSAQTIVSGAPAGQYWITAGVGDPLPQGIVLPMWFDETTNYLTIDEPIAVSSLSGSLPMTFTLSGTLTGGVSASPPVMMKCKPIYATDVMRVSVRTIR